jgi:hypothetical protein
MSLMSVAEFALWAALGFLFWSKKLQRRFPAMGGYLALRVASMPLLLLFFHGQAAHWFHDLCFPIYFYTYWTVYIASAVFLYFICVEVFRSVLSAFPGLMRFGVVIFRWAVLASVIVSFAAVNFSHRGVMLIPEIAFRLMRSVSVVELCLLAFLCLSMNALRLSVRDMAFGISLGFGVMSCNEFIFAILCGLPTAPFLSGPASPSWCRPTLLSFAGTRLLPLWATPEPRLPCSRRAVSS